VVNGSLVITNASVVPGGQAGSGGGVPQNPSPAAWDKLIEDLMAANAGMAATAAILQGATPGSPAYRGLQVQAEAAKQAYAAYAAAAAAQQTAYKAEQAAIAKEGEAQQALDDCRKNKAEENCPPPPQAAQNPSTVGGNGSSNNGAGGAANGPGAGTAGANAIGQGGTQVTAGATLPACLEPGDDRCNKWYLPIAQQRQIAADEATRALATAQSDLNQAARYDAQSKQIEAHAADLSRASADVGAQAAADAQKAAAADTPQSAAPWNKLADDAVKQRNDLSDQAQTAYGQANALQAQAQALRDKVATEKAAEARLKASAAAAWADYGKCLKLPPCPPKDDNASVIPSPTGNPVSGNSGALTGALGLAASGAAAVGGLPGVLGLGALTALSSNLFGSAPVAPTVQYIIIAITINIGAAGSATTAESRRPPVNTHDGSQFPIHRAARIGGTLQNVAFHPREDFALSARGGTSGPEVSSGSSGGTSTEGGMTFSLAASGTLGSGALEFRVVDPSGRVKNIAIPEGVVLEPLRPGVIRPAGGNAVSRQLTAYCLEIAKLPPEPNQLYRIAPQALQDKFKPLKSVLEAGSKLAAAGQFHPDSDPAAYTDFIRQNALWAKMENWGEQKFAEVFVERTKKNAEHMKMNWTKEMEQALKNAAPGRWQDIAMVLDEAQKLSGGTGAANASQSAQQ
jgi:hypothetical protein